VRIVVKVWRLSRSGPISLDRSTAWRRDVADNRHTQLDVDVRTSDARLMWKAP
jgi:hypothetical protein